MKQVVVPIGLIAILSMACTVEGDVEAEERADALIEEIGYWGGGAAAPGDLVQVPTPAGMLEFRPFTGGDFENTKDPINIVFIGDADPRGLMQALLDLDGDRTAFGMPNVFPFNCTWSPTAMGSEQTGYATDGGWTGGIVQVHCGDFQTLRFHIRLFRANGFTIGSAHFELNVPATHVHEVVDWELAQQLVTVDFLRSGILDASLPMFPTGPITPVPSFGEINPLLYNGLPVEIRAAIGGPLANQAAPVPIGNDGSAMVFNVAAAPTPRPGRTDTHLTINFNQVLPKPFCPGPLDAYVHVFGTLDLHETVTITRRGTYFRHFTADAQGLAVTPINPFTGQPTGPTEFGDATERHTGILSNRIDLLGLRGEQFLETAAGSEGYTERLLVGSGFEYYKYVETCP